MDLQRHVAATVLLLGVTFLPEAMSALPQGAGSPTSFPLSEVEIRLHRESGDGCVGRCLRYRIAIRGDGVVEYEDLGDPPTAGIQRRGVAVSEVVSLVNEFLGARFFEAPDKYEEEPSVVLEGDSLRLRRMTGVGGTTWDMNLRMGTLTKTVRLYLGYPAHLAKLRDLIERMGGPQAWPEK